MGKLKDKLNQSASIVKWKVDQQFRINSSQTKERQIMGEIDVLKKTLSSEAYKHYQTETLTEDSLIEICSKINQLQQNLHIQQQETIQIKAEEPPVLSSFDHDFSNSAEIPETIDSGLICPKCKRPVPIRFCPDCGEEGVPPDR